MLRRLSIFIARSLIASAALAADSPQIVSLKKIWDEGNHNAFTDLIRFREEWFCTFREADDHVGGDGKVRVLASQDGEVWKSAALLAEDGIDLRDPKLSVTSDGRLMIVAGGSVYQGTKVLKGRQPRVAFSQDGRRWTPTRRILAEGDWLWRVTWHKKKAYGVSYYIGLPDTAPDEWDVKLFESSNGVEWSLVTKLEIPGRPNETTLRFLADDQCVALARREGQDRQAWIGSSRRPYKQWQWKPAGLPVGGPNFIVLPGGSMIAGGRLYGADRNNKTALGTMSHDGYAPQITLPSGGDNSYPGLVWQDGVLWVSYYSSHEGKTSIYLAKVRWPGGIMNPAKPPGHSR